MKRLVTEQIIHWYASKDERILLLSGGYGVGKTWIARAFCREYDQDYIYISMENIDESLGLTYMSSDTTFMVIDDVNDDESLVRTCSMILKLRGDEAIPDYRIIILSSMVKLSSIAEYILNQKYVKIIKMFPMNFEEFKRAIIDKRELDGAARLDDLDIYKLYLVAGGMPECVSLLLEGVDLAGVRCKQREIVSRICGVLAGKAARAYTKEGEILENIFRQGMVDGAGFSLGQVRKSARTREYGQALANLERCGLVYRVIRYGVMREHRVRGYKLYITDVGLAGAVGSIDERLILEDDKLYTEYNGYLMITFMLQEYLAHMVESQWEICYWHKQRAKARLPLMFKHRVDHTVVVVGVDIPYRHSLARSIDSFIREYGEAKAVNLSLQDVTSGALWHKII